MEASEEKSIPTILDTAWYQPNTAVQHVAAYQWWETGSTAGYNLLSVSPA